MIDKGCIIAKNDRFDILNMKEIKEFMHSLYQQELDKRSEFETLTSELNRDAGEP